MPGRRSRQAEMGFFDGLGWFQLIYPPFKKFLPLVT
jgi:hypothetical protein